MSIISIEKAAGRKAARKLNGELMVLYGSFFVRRHKSPDSLFDDTVTAHFKQGYLDRLTIHTKRHSFIQHYGWDAGRNKTTGRFQSTGVFNSRSNSNAKSSKNRVHPGTEHFSQITFPGSALENLADTIGDLRAYEVVSKIKF